MNTTRLMVDRNYWDEMDPTDGEATHYKEGFCPNWYNLDKGEFFSGGGNWKTSNDLKLGRITEEDLIPKPVKEKPKTSGWDESTRGPQMSGTTGNRIWKYQMPIAESFTMKLPEGAQIIRIAGENGFMWLWAVVDTSAPLEERHFDAFKAGGTMPDDLSRHEYVGMGSIYIQQELMLYFFEKMV